MSTPHDLPTTTNSSSALPSHSNTPLDHERLADGQELREWDVERPVEYEEIKQLSLGEHSDVIILDVREPPDYNAGHIPTALNLPATSFEESLNLDEVDFTRRHSFPKPQRTDRVLLYCRSGRRSGIALEICRGAGWGSVRNYSGSWLDWEVKEAEAAAARGEGQDAGEAGARS